MKKKLLKVMYIFLAFCTRVYLKRNTVKSIGITGSVGKTSCRTVVYEILKQYSNKKIYTSPKNYNSELGLIFSIFEIEDYVPSMKNLICIVFSVFYRSIVGKPNYEIIVLEYGIDRPKDMEFLVSIHKPDIGVFTKLDYTHSDFFPGGKHEVGEEKCKLFYAAREKVFLNKSDDFCREKFSNPKDELFFDPSSKNNKTELYWREEELLDYKIIDNAGLEENNIFDRKQKDIYSCFQTLGRKIITNEIGEANAHYINLGLQILSYLNIEGKIEDTLFFKLPTQKSRFSIFEGKNHSILVDSTYNAGPESMKKIIADTLSLQQTLYSDYKIGFCLGDMREIGPDSQKLHKQLYDQINFSDLIVSIGPESRDAFGEKTQSFLSSKEAGIYLQEFLQKSEEKYIILFKGSQNTIFVEEALVVVLEDSENKEKVCRQEDFWIREKNEFFKKL